MSNVRALQVPSLHVVEARCRSCSFTLRWAVLVLHPSSRPGCAGRLFAPQASSGRAAPRSASCRVAPFNLGISPPLRQQGWFKSGTQGRFAPTCCAVQSARSAAARQVWRSNSALHVIIRGIAGPNAAGRQFMSLNAQRPNPSVNRTSNIRLRLLSAAGYLER